MSSERMAIVKEARTWIGTPYHKMARVKGAGADCFTFIAEVMISQGIFERDDLPVYSDDWFAHQSEEVYLKLLFRHCGGMLKSLTYVSSKLAPGNIITMRTANSKIFNHGAIVSSWPKIIHCIYEGVVEMDASRDPMWSYQEIQVFDPFKGKQ